MCYYWGTHQLMIVLKEYGDGNDYHLQYSLGDLFPSSSFWKAIELEFIKCNIYECLIKVKQISIRVSGLIIHRHVTARRS